MVVIAGLDPQQWGPISAEMYAQFRGYRMRNMVVVKTTQPVRLI